ncbi:BatA domain-containing protein [Sediminibacter sp. Hel_I_10]|uniref:BatA domain-containing protein n=1 Tax=Sediminibacter sp. Hel_I_10 TaxID=1392490 RepID=UPI00047A9561|nr:BatA domain-containing protein [Sediminibacter sp. Hel_I_10]
MQFKYPELLYALLLLVIPIIVHLFQLRRFQKVAFTNVQFLKRITIQTRKSSQLKKWLTLLIRLLLLTCIILAFAQPYFSNTDTFNTKNETVIYLDNSFSMQAQGANGTLLNRAVQDILERVDGDDPISILTNTSSFKNTTLKAIKNDLIDLKYTPNQLTYEAALLKGKQLFSEDNSAVKNLVFISDFQQKDAEFSNPTDSLVRLRLVKLTPTNLNNIAIDSTFIAKRSIDNLELEVVLKNFGDPIENVPVSLYNKNKLIAKSAVTLDGKNSVIFTIPTNSEFDGKIAIEDPNLQYDNSLYFNLEETAKINVLSINDADDAFLSKIYSEDEFSYTATSFKNLNYNSINNQNLVVLNELNSVPSSLTVALKAFTDDGGSVLIIPSENAQISDYNALFSNYNLGSFNELKASEKMITAINFSHPLLTNVFDKRISNFQYPKVNSFFDNSANATSAILSYENGQSFLSGMDQAYRFSAALNDDNSNFKNSPLIVPVLYNIGKQSLKMGDLYYEIASENRIDIPVTLTQDEILSLDDGENSVIPLQRTYANKVALTTNDYPEKAGIISVKNNERILKNMSFNYNRSESQLRYLNLENLNGVTVSDSVATAIDDIKSASNVNELWKWFVIFALIFLLIELLILKFLK